MGRSRATVGQILRAISERQGVGGIETTKVNNSRKAMTSVQIFQPHHHTIFTAIIVTLPAQQLTARAPVRSVPRLSRRLPVCLIPKVTHFCRAIMSNLSDHLALIQHLGQQRTTTSATASTWEDGMATALNQPKQAKLDASVGVLSLWPRWPLDRDCRNDQCNRPLETLRFAIHRET